MATFTAVFDGLSPASSLESDREPHRCR